MALLLRVLFRKGGSPAVFLWALLIVMGSILPACTSEDSTGSPSEPATPGAIDSTKQVDAIQPSPERAEPVAPREGRSLTQKLDDARLETRVKEALVEDSRLRVFNLVPDAYGSRVTLRGDVNTAGQYSAAEQVARRVSGVDSVTNALTMDGRPVTEERLSAAESSSSDQAVHHTVRRGETLWSIARQYDTSVRRLRALNALQSGTLRPGQRIRIR